MKGIMDSQGVVFKKYHDFKVSKVKEQRFNKVY